MLSLLQKSNLAKAKLAHRFVSQITRDVRAAQSLKDPLTYLDTNSTHQGRFAWQLPDYDLNANDTAHNFESLALPHQHTIDPNSRVHPMEAAAKQERPKADVFTTLKPN
jgi:hypothetical protein